MLLLIFYLFYLVAQEFEAETGNEILIEELQALTHNPIQINTAKQEEFAKIYWISPTLASSIVKTRERIGGFKKVADLLKVPGMSDEIFDKINPYRAVVAIHELPLQFEFRARIQEIFPSESNKGVGNPLKAYERVKLRYKNIESTMLVEKDAYEQNYTDFVTYGVLIRINDRLPKLSLGDYKLEFGEGLVFGFPPIVTFKNQGVIKDRERSIQLYTNSGENNFLRGACGELKITNHIKNFIFFSDAKLDGKIEDSEISIYYDYEGDHSTESGLANKDRIKEKLLGTRFEYRKGIKFGLTYYRNLHFLNPEGNKIGSHNLFGIDFSYFFKDVEYFCEVARCDESHAAVVGIEYKAKRLKSGALYRYYPSDFYAFHSSPWAARSVLTEKGSYIYTGYKISRTIGLTFYFDSFTRLPKLNSTDLPERGLEYSWEIEYIATKYLSFTCRYYPEFLEEAESKRIRLQADAKLKNVNLRVRVEKVYETGRSEVNTSYGELLYGDVGIKLFKELTFTTRLILFNSNLYKFRLYEYEQDLPGVMRNQFIRGEGTRLYLLIRGLITSFCGISAKYELTSKINTSPIQKYGIQLDLRI